MSEVGQKLSVLPATEIVWSTSESGHCDDQIKPGDHTCFPVSWNASDVTVVLTGCSMNPLDLPCKPSMDVGEKAAARLCL